MNDYTTLTWRYVASSTMDSKQDLNVTMKTFKKQRYNNSILMEVDDDTNERG